jgi:hypothetical protein
MHRSRQGTVSHDEFRRGTRHDRETPVICISAPACGTPAGTRCRSVNDGVVRRFRPPPRSCDDFAGVRGCADSATVDGDSWAVPGERTGDLCAESRTGMRKCHSRCRSDLPGDAARR